MPSVFVCKTSEVVQNLYFGTLSVSVLLVQLWRLEVEVKMSVIVRDMRKDDLEKGFLDTLNELSDTGDCSMSYWYQVCNEIVGCSFYRIFVAEANGEIIGAITLLLERKFIHRGGLVGHIEDVVVQRDWQGRGVGKMLVEHAIDRAKRNSCYKVILDCGEHNVPFYENCGFRRHEVCMRFDIKQPAVPQ